jgi:hypothetical protein
VNPLLFASCTNTFRLQIKGDSQKKKNYFSKKDVLYFDTVYFRKWIGLNSKLLRIQRSFCIEPCVILGSCTVQYHGNIDKLTFVWVMSPAGARRTTKPFGETFLHKGLRNCFR